MWILLHAAAVKCQLWKLKKTEKQKKRHSRLSRESFNSTATVWDEHIFMSIYVNLSLCLCVCWRFVRQISSSWLWKSMQVLGVSLDGFNASMLHAIAVKYQLWNSKNGEFGTLKMFKVSCNFTATFWHEHLLHSKTWSNIRRVGQKNRLLYLWLSSWWEKYKLFSGKKTGGHDGCLASELAAYFVCFTPFCHLWLAVTSLWFIIFPFTIAMIWGRVHFQMHLEMMLKTYLLASPIGINWILGN